MSPQTCLEVWERSWGKDCLQDRSGEPVAEGRLTFLRPEFSPYVSTMQILGGNFERAVSTSHNIISIVAEGAASFCPGENETGGAQENWSDHEQQGLESQRLVLNTVWWCASPFAQLLVDPIARSWRQCYLNMHLNFILSLSPWYSSALAALSDPFEWRNMHCGTNIKYP